VGARGAGRPLLEPPLTTEFWFPVPVRRGEGSEVPGAGTHATAGPRRGGSDAPVLVVDDQLLFRGVASDVVRATPGLTLVGEAASGEEAIAAVESLLPRLVIMDKRMPGIGGIEAARVIRTRFPPVVVVIVSVEQPATEALATCGAVTFLPKRKLSPRVLTEIWTSYGD
jgi:CheY-like chemotaxis protein